MLPNLKLGHVWEHLYTPTATIMYMYHCRVQASMKTKCHGYISGTRFHANSAEFGGGLFATSDGTACDDQDDCYTIPITRNVQTYPTPRPYIDEYDFSYFAVCFYPTIAARDAFFNRNIFIPTILDDQVAWDGRYYTFFDADFGIDPDTAPSIYPFAIDFYTFDNLNTYTGARNYTVEVDGSATRFTQNEAVGGAGGAIYMEQMATVNITCDTVEVS